jgi:hypothetical protein
MKARSVFQNILKHSNQAVLRFESQKISPELAS